MDGLVVAGRAVGTPARGALGGRGQRHPAPPAQGRPHRCATLRGPPRPGTRGARPARRAFALPVAAARSDRVQEAGRPPGAARARGPRPGPRQVDHLAGPGHPDVQQPALLLHRRGRGRHGDGHRPVGQPRQQDHVPLQTLGGVKGRQRHPVQHRGVLLVGPHLQVGDELAQAGRRVLGHEPAGVVDQGGQGLPAVAHLAPPGRRFRRPARTGEHVGHVLGQAGTGEPLSRGGCVPGDLGRAPEQDDGLAHLAAGEEPVGPAHQVGQGPVAEGLLQHLELAVGPHEHRDVHGPDAPGEQVHDPLRRGVGLRDVVVVLGEGGRPEVEPRRRRHRRTSCAGQCLRTRSRSDGAQPGGRDPRGGRQHGVAELDHAGAGPVAADQVDHGGPRVRTREPAEQRGVRPGKGVDGLVGVAHDADVVPLPHPRLQQHLLGGRHVLVLVDGEPAVAGADRPRHVLALAQHGRRQQQDVLEVDDAPRGPGVLVGLEQARHHRRVVPGDLPAPGGRRRGGVRGGGEQPDLRPLQLRGQVTDRAAVHAQPQPGGGLPDDRGLVLQQRRCGAPDHGGPEVLQLAQRGRVEGPGSDPGGAQAP